MSYFDFAVKGYNDHQITPEDYIKKIEDGEAIILLDVRSISEYYLKHIEGAVMYPLEQFEKNIQNDYPDRTQTYVIYCAHGVRSFQAYKIMKKMGYQNIYDLGGIEMWPYETVSEY